MQVNPTQSVTQLYQSHYLQRLRDQLDLEAALMRSIIGELDKLRISGADEHSHQEVYESKQRILQLIDDRWKTASKRTFAQVYGELEESLHQLFVELPETVEESQGEQRFMPTPEDKRKIRFYKSSKRRIHFFLKFFNKKRTFETWKHQVPARNLATYYFQGEVLCRLHQISADYFKTVCSLYLKIKLDEEKNTSLDQEHLEELRTTVESTFTELSTRISNQIAEILDEVSALYCVQYEKVGTIELSSGRFSVKRVKSKYKSAAKKWGSNHHEWSNTLFALFEEWRCDLSVVSLQQKSRELLQDFQEQQVKKLTEQLAPHFLAARNLMREAYEQLEKATPESLSKSLKKINLTTCKKLDLELLPAICERLASSHLTNLLNKLVIDIHEHVEQLSDEHIIVKSESYDTPLAADELKSISPYELISFEMLDEFDQQVETIKKDLFQALEGMVTRVTDIDNIISFSVRSAIASLEENTTEHEEAARVAKAGLERAIGRLASIEDKVNETVAETSSKIENTVGRFAEQVFELTVNENVGELRLRITKAKAAKSAEEVRQSIKDRYQRAIYSVRHRAGEVFSYLRNLVRSISSRFILTAAKPTITKEVSDFLLTSQSAINGLPVIYQRLYQIEPLKEFELFEGRTAEIEKLDRAFENWTNGRYAATAIIGEKWGGLTTFVNYAVSRSKYPFLVSRFSSKENISSREDFLKVMQKLLQNESLQSFEEVVAYLNEGPKRVVILEELQNLYIRRIGGFAGLEMLFQLIASTYSNVFWVTTSTIYAWQYLSKTLRIHDHFSYVIEMGTLSGEEIVNIIWKRNRMSGYNIKFEAPEALSRDKKFVKLSDEQKQEFLKNKYFEGLNDFAKSNVSLALIFWLLSTKRIDDSSIIVGSFEKPDLDFIKVLSMDKVHALHALILHDGLIDTQLGQVLSLSHQKVRLLLATLMEDGIIVLKSSIYWVNPIVYRNVILLLKAKNLIH